MALLEIVNTRSEGWKPALRFRWNWSASISVSFAVLQDSQ
jgi:hypothetical protein